MKKILVGVCALFMLAGSASAAEFIAPKAKQESNLNIGAGESHKNLYVAAASLGVNGDTMGDLTAAGGTVNLSGRVEKGLLLAGGNLFVNGAVGENARIAGGNIEIGSAIGGDLVVAGGNITLTEKATVNGDMAIAGGSVRLEGPVGGSVRFAGGDLYINSKIGGDVSAKVGNRITFGPNAQVGGKVSYSAPQKASIDANAKLGMLAYTPMQRQNRGGVAAILTFALLVKILAWFLVAWILLRFKGNAIERLNTDIKQKPWENLGLGFLALIVWPLAAVIILFTLVGYYIALIMLVAYVLALMFTLPLATIFAGSLAIGYLTKPLQKIPSWQVAALGVVLWQILMIIPLLGWLVCIVVYLMVWGAGIKMLKHSLMTNN